jgi:D-3-phosphoglycerate dehydrogenase
MKEKVLVATEKPFAREAIAQMKEIIEEAGFEFILFEKYQSHNELIDKAKDVNALIVRSDKVDKSLFEAAKNLKIVVRAGAGYDNIDLDAATEKKVVAMNTPGQNSNAVAELVLGMMVYTIRNHFNGTAGTELRGKKMGIHAYGHVGRIVGLIAKGFGMKVYSFDPFIDKIYIENDGVKYEADIDGLYSKCQFISLHLPLTDKTRESVNFELMSKMPEGAMIVNTARKEIINEKDLLRMFEERPDFKYVSDVSPDCAEEIATKYPGRYFFTPKKMGAQTAEANINAGVAAASQIVNFFKNDDHKFQLNTLK